MENTPFVIERTYNAPSHIVWKAITDPEQMKQWYFDIPAFKPVAGTEFDFWGGDETKKFHHLCEVKEVIEGKKLSHSWRYAEFPGDSLVTWELFPEGEKRTRVVLTHSGIETFRGDINPDVKRENFIAGWTDIVSNLLREFVEMDSIRTTTQVKAGKEKIWDILTDPQYTKQWASAFSPGTYVETDWQEGSEVVWKDATGDVGAKGIVTTHVPNSQLIVSFYDDVNAWKGDPLGEYAERYSVSEKDGVTTLNFEAGPLPLKYVKSHSVLWDKAIKIIEELAQK